MGEPDILPITGWAAWSNHNRCGEKIAQPPISAPTVRIEDIEGVEDAVDADPEAEEELRSWLDRLRAAKAKENRNALAYNAGKRLMRFVNAGRLDQDRVLAEIDAALDTWEATP